MTGDDLWTECHISFIGRKSTLCLWAAMNPGRYKVCFHPYKNWRQTHASLRPQVVQSLQPPPRLYGILHSADGENRKGPGESAFHRLSWALPTDGKCSQKSLITSAGMKIPSEVHNVKPRETDLKAAWQPLHPISCVTKPYPGLNDVIYIQLHSTTA